MLLSIYQNPSIVLAFNIAVIRRAGQKHLVDVFIDLLLLVTTWVDRRVTMTMALSVHKYYTYLIVIVYTVHTSELKKL